MTSFHRTETVPSKITKVRVYHFNIALQEDALMAVVDFHIKTEKKSYPTIEEAIEADVWEQLAHKITGEVYDEESESGS